MKNKKSTKRTYTFSLSPKIREMINEMASKDMRSISGFLEWMIVKEYEYRKNKTNINK